MIRMIKGTYGRVVNGVVEAMTKHSEPFSLPEAREAELVAAGVAVKVKADAAQGVDASAAIMKEAEAPAEPDAEKSEE